MFVWSLFATIYSDPGEVPLYWVGLEVFMFTILGILLKLLSI